MAEQAVTEGEGTRRINAALPDIQRLVVSAYAHLPWARYAMFRVEDGSDVAAARSWLGSLVPEVSTASVRDQERALNVALPPKASPGSA